MHRLATVHARDNQPTTNDVTTQPISNEIVYSTMDLQRHCSSRAATVVTEIYALRLKNAPTLAIQARTNFDNIR